jgi:hypothetical protein
LIITDVNMLEVNSWELADKVNNTHALTGTTKNESFWLLAFC